MTDAVPASPFGRNVCETASLVCAFAACLLLPFDAIPVDNILVPRASVYPVLLGAVLWLAGGNALRDLREQRVFALIIAAHALWMLAATLLGLFELRGQGNLSYPLARCLADLISFWIVPLWIACLLKKNAFVFLEKAFMAMFLLLALYGMADLLHLAGWDAATAFLRDSAPWFRKVGTSDGWWPPAVWGHPRMRSLCGSPAFLAQLLCILLPLLVHRLHGGRTSAVCALGAALLMLALTVSGTGFFTLVVLACVGLLVTRRVSPRSRAVIFCGLGALAAALALLYHPLIMKKLHATGRERAAVTGMEFGAAVEHPFFGLGYRLSGRGMEKHFAALSIDIGWEGRLWADNQAKAGPLKNAYPALNAYSRMAAESGFAGLGLFLAAFAFPVLRALRGPGGPNPEKTTLCLMLCAVACFWLGEDSHSSFAPYFVLGALAAMASTGTTKKTGAA